MPGQGTEYRNHSFVPENTLDTADANTSRKIATKEIRISAAFHAGIIISPQAHGGRNANEQKMAAPAPRTAVRTDLR